MEIQSSNEKLTENGCQARRKSWKSWTVADLRYLKKHRHDPVSDIAAALDRTENAVYLAASRFGISLARSKQPYTECPICGAPMTPGTESYRRGLCISCWNRRKAEAMRRRETEDDTEREYQRAKKQAYRRSK